jgi:LysR family transcriptional regulator, regulator of abg operon
MKLQHLRSLVAVYESGSLQQATKRLHISQPALSRTLQALEEELGVALLVRSSQGVTLTPFGLRLIEHARHVLESVGRAQRDIEEMKGDAARRVSIGMTAVAALSMSLEDAFVAFHAKFPETRLSVHELRPSAITAMLREGTLDFALSTHPPETSSGLDVSTVCHIPLRISARCGHPLQHAKHLSELREALWVTSASGSHTVFQEFFLQNGLQPPERVFECSSLTMALDAMVGLDALAMGPQMSERMSSSLYNQIRPLQIEETLPDRPLLMISLNRELLPASAELMFKLAWESLQRSHPPAA